MLYFYETIVLSEYWFCPMNNNQDCRQNRYPLFTAGHYVGPMSESDCSSLVLKMLSALSYNQDGHQNGRNLSVCTCEHSNLSHLSSDFFQISYMLYFYETIVLSEYWFCPMNDNQDFRQNRYPLFTAGHYAGPMSESDCSSLVLKMLSALSYNQDGHQNGRHLSVCTCEHSNLSHLSYDFFQISYTVELWSLELACLEHLGSLELIRQSRQFPYTFNVKIHPRLEQRWLELLNSKHSPQGDFSCKNTMMARTKYYFTRISHTLDLNSLIFL